jgi:hypothetical protein
VARPQAPARQFMTGKRRLPPAPLGTTELEALQAAIQRIVDRASTFEDEAIRFGLSRHGLCYRLKHAGLYESGEVRKQQKAKARVKPKPVPKPKPPAPQARTPADKLHPWPAVDGDRSAWNRRIVPGWDIHDQNGRPP